MNNSQAFDFSSLKRMTIDNLIAKCRQYVEHYLSKSAASRLDEAYKESRFNEVKYILEKTLKRIKTKTKGSEYKKAEKTVMNEFPDANEIFVYSDNNEEEDNNMGISSGMIAVIVIIVAILVTVIVGRVLYLKFKSKNYVNNQTVGEVLSHGLKKDNSIIYTDEDKDLMELIHELSVIYDNTDKYLNS